MAKIIPALRPSFIDPKRLLTRIIINKTLIDPKITGVILNGTIDKLKKKIGTPTKGKTRLEVSAS